MRNKYLRSRIWHVAYVFYRQFRPKILRNEKPGNFVANSVQLFIDDVLPNILIGMT